MEKSISLVESLLASVIGMSIVFIVLIILIVAIMIMSKLFSKKEENAAVEQAAEEVKTETAAGSCGSVKLFDVPDKTAAMIMAITADKLDVPLNELRFISIKEVKD